MMEAKEAKETIADIVAEFREMVHKSVDGIIAVKADVIADRIEAAWKRDERHALEHATHHAEAVASGNCRDCIYNPQSENYEGGNAAALREALLQVALSCSACPRHNCKGCTRPFASFMPAVRKALSAPPRNCDVGTAEDQIYLHREWCNRDNDSSYCCNDCRDCFARWAQMPYESEAAR